MQIREGLGPKIYVKKGVFHDYVAGLLVTF